MRFNRLHVVFTSFLCASAPATHASSAPTLYTAGQTDTTVRLLNFVNHEFTTTPLIVPQYSSGLYLLDQDEKQETWTTEDVRPRKTQSPTAALMKSMVVPGWGQIGNREYAKAGLVIVVEGTLFARWLHFRNQTVDARAEFESIEDLSLRRQEFNEFEKLRDRRNLFGWLTGTAIFLSMIDAFVGAHLAGFPEENSQGEVEPALSLGVLPATAGSTSPVNWQLGIRIKF